MYIFDISKVSLFLKDAHEDNCKGLTYLTLDYHNISNEEIDKLTIVNSIINMYKMLIKGDKPPYDDLISIMEKSHEEGDVDIISILLDEYFTGKINHFIHVNKDKAMDVSIDGFITDFKEVYHSDGYHISLKNVFDKTINDFTNYLMMFKDLDWDKLKEELLVGMEIINPINNNKVISLPIIDIRCGVYYKGFELSPLLKTGIVGHKLKTYFEEIRRNNPNFDKLKCFDVYTYDHSFSKLMRYQIDLIDDRYSINPCYSY